VLAFVQVYNARRREWFPASLNDANLSQRPACLRAILACFTRPVQALSASFSKAEKAERLNGPATDRCGKKGRATNPVSEEDANNGILGTARNRTVVNTPGAEDSGNPAIPYLLKTENGLRGTPPRQRQRFTQERCRALYCGVGGGFCRCTSLMLAIGKRFPWLK
jgi:hypothetical protein